MKRVEPVHTRKVNTSMLRGRAAATNPGLKLPESPGILMRSQNETLSRGSLTQWSTLALGSSLALKGDKIENDSF